MRIENEIRIKRILDFEAMKFGSLNRVFVAYKSVIDYDGNFEVSEGVCGLSGVNDFKEGKDIVDTDRVLCRKDIETAHKKGTPLSLSIVKYRIDNPYTYIMENGAENVSMYRVNERMNELIDVDDKIVMSPIHFDYLKGSVHDGEFNLDEVIEVLSKNDDIEMFKDNGNNKIKIPKTDVMSELGEKYLSFVYTPNDKELLKLQDESCFSLMTRYDHILDNILGLKKCRI